MKSLLALAAATMLAAPAAPPPPKWSDAIPPAEYQGLGLVPVLYVEPWEIKDACSAVGTPPEGLVIVACTITLKDGQKLIILPDPCDFGDGWFAGVACHENAHALKNWNHE